MSNYIEFKKIQPITIKSILDVVKSNKYLSALDIKQLSEIGCPIMTLLVENNEKISDLEELFLLIREKKITFDDVKNAINEWRKET